MEVFDRGIRAANEGDLASAARLFREAAAQTLNNLAYVYSDLGDAAGAIRTYRQALELEPGTSEAAYALSLLLLAEGRYEEAWPLFEARRRLPRIYTPAVRPVLPEWTGGDPSGQRIAVFGEQGFGDQIMFGRYLRALEARGASASYFCAGEVAPLIPHATAVLNEQLLRAHDGWVYAGSLPLRFGTTLQSVPTPLALSAGPGGGGVGVMVRGRPTNHNDAHRSLDPAAAQTVLALGRDLHPEATGARTFAETAEIIGGLDLVITVDTAVAHLAASMGKPTWVLLPERFTDWRWGRAGESTAWYPSVRLFRQRRRGDWSDVLDEVRAALAAL